jgi:hypothetical protein
MAAAGELHVRLVSLMTVTGVLMTDPPVETGVHRHAMLDVPENPAPSTVTVVAVSTGPNFGIRLYHDAEKENSKGML